MMLLLLLCNIVNIQKGDKVKSSRQGTTQSQFLFCYKFAPTTWGFNNSHRTSLFVFVPASQCRCYYDCFIDEIFNL